MSNQSRIQSVVVAVLGVCVTGRGVREIARYTEMATEKRDRKRERAADKGI